MIILMRELAALPISAASSKAVMSSSPSSSSSSSSSPPITGNSFIEAADIPSQILAMLKKHPIFASINDDNFLYSLADAMHPRFAQCGDVIVKEGDEAKNMFFVIKGTVQVQSNDGEVILAQLHSGSFFGEIAILFSVNRTATVCAKTKCVLARLSAEELYIILERYPDVALAINNEAEKRFAELKREMDKAGKRIPSMIFEGMHEKRKRDFFTKSSSFKSLSQRSRRNSDLDITSLSTSPSKEFMYALPVNHETGERSVPTEPSSLQKKVIIDQQTQDSLCISNMYSSPNNDVASLGDSSTQVTPEVTTQAGSSASEDNEDDPYDDDDDEEVFSQSIDEVEALHASEDSSSTSESDKSSSMPTGGRGHPMLAAFANQNGARRRASVAVWSDDKLMQLANLKMGAVPAEPSKPKPHDELSLPVSSAVKGRFSDFFVESDNDDEIMDDLAVDPHESEEEKIKFGLLGKSIMARILQYLPFTTIFKFRGISRAYAGLITQPEHGLTNHIDLSAWHKKINDKSLSDIATYIGPKTTKLNMKNCWGVTDKGLIKAATCLPEIQHWILASVWDISDTGLVSLSRSCNFLVTIVLSNCRKITDAGVLAVLSACPNLTNMTLSYCKNLTDVVLDHPQWRRIRRLDLQRCTGITDAGFERWRHPFTIEQRSSVMSNGQANGHHIPNGNSNNSPSNNPHLEFAMEELCLADCSFLTDNTITSLSLSCHSLRVLSLSFCCALSESFAVPLVAGCPALEQLDMSFCGGAITDSSLEILGKGLASSLDKLSIRGCIQITDLGLDNLADHALALRKINVSNCKSITQAGLSSHNWEPLSHTIFSNEKLEKGPRQRYSEGY